MSDHTDVAIVGAGFAGIGLAIRLQRSGLTDFTVFERADAVGGTWRDNSYPGVACDIPAHLYSLSFHSNPEWSHVFAQGHEIRDYLEGAADEVRSRIRLNTPVHDMEWDDARQLWVLTTPTGIRTARVMVLACGRLADPFIPRIDGLAGFPGEMFHSARWNHEVDFAGKRVAVVGSGASAVQLMPHIAEVAKHVTVFQRSAPYVVPRADREYSDAERGLFAKDPDEIPRLRSALFWAAEEGFAERAGDPRRTEAARARALAHLEANIADPRLRELLTPDYEIGCKRILISNDYYPAFERHGVTLVPSPIKSVDGSSVVGADGTAHEVDVIVFATGFLSAEQPYATRVRGRDETLAEHWKRGMRAYATTMVAGFPQMFVLDGPNSGLGHNSAVHMIESQIDFVLRALASGGALNVSPAAEQEWTERLDSRADGTVWTAGGCESWYVDPRNGRLALLWPGFAHEFRKALRDAALPVAPPTEPATFAPDGSRSS
ncbi:MAG TPA: NAD(P)/FAD-dependent oxidoreductase [Pseudolysinimonas sp.]|nr:NAD(P)/FAD-dependent oxidoreductase [Pseudolysinimonas sp.]